MKGRPWLPPLVWAGVIAVLTSVPASMVPRQLGPFDKVVHFTMYAVLAALLTRAYREHRTVGRVAVVIIATIAAFGAVDEWHQKFIPGRSTELADWIADTLGGTAGVLAASLLLPRWSRRPNA